MNTRAAAALVAITAAASGPLAAQTVRLSVFPDTVTVGQPFGAGVWVTAPAGSRMELIITPAAGGRWQTVGTVARADSAELLRAVQTLVAWVPGARDTARAEIRLTGADGAARTIPIAIPLPVVRSVLPGDTATPDPRGPKDIIPTPRALPWAWMLAAAALLIISLLGWMWMRRRRGPATVTPRDARRQALAELDALQSSGMIERGDLEGFYARKSAIVREFAAAADPALGTHLTTREMMEILASRGADAGELSGVLADADLAKFARHHPSPERARGDWKAAREWVASFGAPSPELEEVGR